MADDQADEADLTGNRTSPLEQNGGVATGPPGPAEHLAHVSLKPEGEVDDGQPPAYVASKVLQHKYYRVKHPPIDCPNPSRMSTMRGFYHCPACGTKVKLRGDGEWKHDLARREDEALDAIAAALGQCWYIAWSSTVYLAQLAWWAVLVLYDRTLGRLKSKQAVTENTGGVGPKEVSELVIMLATASMISAKYRGSAPVIPVIPAQASELAVTPANETEEISRSLG